MGISFQTKPGEPPSRVIVHATLWGNENIQDQETIGILGVNLIYGAMVLHENPEVMVESLIDNMPKNRVEVDMVEVSGPAFEGVDNRLIALKLVEGGLSNATIFMADGRVVEPADVLYRKPILVERGSFRPVTKLTLEMLQCAKAQFIQEPGVEGEEPVVLMEMTIKNLITQSNSIDHQDFLERVDILGALGCNVLISNYGEFHRLAAYLFRCTKRMIGISMGVPTLKAIFEEKYYTDLEGGILESFGRLFKNDLKFFVCPFKDPKTGSLITAGNLRVAPHLRHLYQYLFENQFILGLKDVDPELLRIFSRDVMGKIVSGDETWEEDVPEQVAAMIKERKLFNLAESRATEAEQMSAR